MHTMYGSDVYLIAQNHELHREDSETIVTDKDKAILRELGKKIAELRKESGLTQIEFAKRVGVGIKLVRNLEQGRKTVRVDKLNQIVAFLGYHLEVVKNERNY